jgi:hypothetical protein
VQTFGVPEPGKRVFIRTVVEVNGRQSSPWETNYYFNSVARTEIDFPVLKPGADAPERR